MTSLSFAECCRLLVIDPKTLRQQLAQAQMAFHTDPANAKIKCLDIEPVFALARLHGRVLKPEASASALFRCHSRPTFSSLSHASRRRSESQASADAGPGATLQAQLVDLTLQLLREREQHTEQPLQSLEAERGSGGADEMTEPIENGFTVVSQVVLPAFVRHATEKRKRLIPLIEYGARGRYVLIDPQEGELAITPDSPEWFEWVASLSSFRFVGQSGHFSARRGFNQHPNRGWYAQRTIHQQFRGKYIGTSEHVTLARLEYIAAELQLPRQMR